MKHINKQKKPLYSLYYYTGAISLCWCFIIMNCRTYYIVCTPATIPAPLFWYKIGVHFYVLKTTQYRNFLKSAVFCCLNRREIFTSKIGLNPAFRGSTFSFAPILTCLHLIVFYCLNINCPQKTDKREVQKPEVRTVKGIESRSSDRTRFRDPKIGQYRV